MKQKETLEFAMEQSWKEKPRKTCMPRWGLLAAKTATSRSSLPRKYLAAWRQPARGRGPWFIRWRVRREKWTFLQSLANDDVKNKIKRKESQHT